MSKILFRGTKLIKKCETKSILRLKITESSAKGLAPSFANTMLYAVPFLRLVFSSLNIGGI